MSWYQNAVINGVAMPAQRKGDTSQRRWAELLAPLVPPEGSGRLFLELGCNAGFYLRQACDLGYRTIGVEREPAFVEQASYWESQEPKGVEIVQDTIEDWDVPACYVCLLACTHYWMTAKTLDELLARLRERSLFLIVQGKHRGESIILPDRAHLLRRMDGWQVVNQTRTRKHYAVLFRSPVLCEMNTEELYAARLAVATERERAFFPAFEDFVCQVLSGQRFDHLQTDFAEYLRGQRLRYREMLMWGYARLIEDVQQNGIREPLTLRGGLPPGAIGGLVENGHHRLVIAKLLGIPYLICRAT